MVDTSPDRAYPLAAKAVDEMARELNRQLLGLLQRGDFENFIELVEHINEMTLVYRTAKFSQVPVPVVKHLN